MSLIDGIIGGVIAAIVGGFSNFLAQRYFFNKLGKGLDRFESKILSLTKRKTKPERRL